MTDAFTAAIAQETARLLRENSRFLNQPQAIQAIAVAVSARNDWMAVFEEQLEQRLQAASERVIDRWAQNLQQEGATLQGALTATNQADGSPLQSAQSGLLNQLFKGWLSRERVSESESARSQKTAKRYQQSRGQVQRQLSGELARGKRYQ